MLFKTSFVLFLFIWFFIVFLSSLREYDAACSRFKVPLCFHSSHIKVARSLFLMRRMNWCLEASRTGRPKGNVHPNAIQVRPSTLNAEKRRRWHQSPFSRTRSMTSSSVCLLTFRQYGQRSRIFLLQFFCLRRACTKFHFRQMECGMWNVEDSWSFKLKFLKYCTPCTPLNSYALL